MRVMLRPMLLHQKSTSCLSSSILAKSYTILGTNISPQKAILKIKILFQLVGICYFHLIPWLHGKMRFRPQEMSGCLIPTNFGTCCFLLRRGLCEGCHASYIDIYKYLYMRKSYRKLYIIFQCTYTSVLFLNAPHPDVFKCHRKGMVYCCPVPY